MAPHERGVPALLCGVIRFCFFLSILKQGGVRNSTTADASCEVFLFAHSLFLQLLLCTMKLSTELPEILTYVAYIIAVYVKGSTIL